MQKQHRRNKRNSRVNLLRLVQAGNNHPEEKTKESNNTVGGYEEEGVLAKRVSEVLNKTADDAGGFHELGADLMLIFLMLLSPHYRVPSLLK